MKVRTRFAPSPTGSLHVGSARTALFSWLYARKHMGEFVLRIEDTDLERSSEESVQAILEGMQWLGLDYDLGPFYQTKRMDHYHKAIEKLLATDHAYYCNCSKERLETLRAEQMQARNKPRYDGHCRDLKLKPTPGVSVVRFRNPLNGDVVYEDQVYGSISISNTELDDLIIARSDGTPTYNLTVVVDDWEMQITHVLRGDDHINNTPRQINILRALGAHIPVYAHMPMILGPDGKRLSKRHGAVNVMQYREEGILPDALLNYLVRLGWSHGNQEIFTRQEMIEFFDISNISKGASAFNNEKLLWLNQNYMKSTPTPKLADELQWQFKCLNVPTDDGPKLSDIIKLQLDRCKSVKEMAEKSRYFYMDFDNYDEKSARKYLTQEIYLPLELLYINLRDLMHWEEKNMHQVVIGAAEHFDLKLSELAQPIRVAITGSSVSPPIDMTLYFVGQERVKERLLRALQYIRNQDQSQSAVSNT